MKIAILGTLDEKENSVLKDAAEKLGHLCDILDIDDIILEVNGKNSNIFWVKGDILSYDIYLVRDVFHAMKKAILIIEWLRNKKRKVIDNNLAVVKYTINKLKTFFDLTNAGLPVPRTLYCQSKKHFLRCVEEIGYPVIIKSNSSGRGSGVYKCDDEEEVYALLKKLESKGKDYTKYLIQEYIPYKRDLRVFILGWEAVAVMQRIPRPGEFRANFSLGGSVKKVELTARIKDLAERATKAVLAEFAGVDLLETESGYYYVLEVNRGAPGITGISSATGINFAKKIINYLVDSYEK